MAHVGLQDPTMIPALSRWKGSLVWGLLGCGWLWATLVLAAPADEAIPIGSITINPMANNRRAVVLLGKAKDVAAYEGVDGFGKPLCGQGFILEDESGSLDVLCLIRCQVNETLPLIGEGERVTVYATIDVSSDNVKNKEGKELLLEF